jgi:hypothetical protein
VAKYSRLARPPYVILGVAEGGSVGLDVTWRGIQLLAEVHPKTLSRTATRVLNHGIRRHSAARGEYELRFLNGPQRSVNRKVQGSNPCPGAKSELDSASARCPFAHWCRNGAATMQQAVSMLAIRDGVLAFQV